VCEGDRAAGGPGKQDCGCKAPPQVSSAEVLDPFVQRSVAGTAAAAAAAVPAGG
jgi:hypothetical protein